MTDSNNENKRPFSAHINVAEAAALPPANKMIPRLHQPAVAPSAVVHYKPTTTAGPKSRHHVRGKNWTKSEDDALRKLVQQVGKDAKRKWTAIAKSMPERTSKQCRERWRQHLRPGLVKGKWTAQEDALLAQLHDLHGNKWSKIAESLPHRTDNDIKNRWNSKKKKKERKRAAKAKQGSDDHSKTTVGRKPRRTETVMSIARRPITGKEIWTATQLNPSISSGHSQTTVGRKPRQTETVTSIACRPTIGKEISMTTQLKESTTTGPHVLRHDFTTTTTFGVVPARQDPKNDATTPHKVARFVFDLPPIDGANCFDEFGLPPLDASPMFRSRFKDMHHDDFWSPSPFKNLDSFTCTPHNFWKQELT